MGMALEEKLADHVLFQLAEPPAEGDMLLRS